MLVAMHQIPALYFSFATLTAPLSPFQQLCKFCQFVAVKDAYFG